MPFSSLPEGAGHLTLTELKARLREAEQTLEAIRDGEVDALVVGTDGQEQVFTLESADKPYRILIEQMQEGALTLTDTGVVLYCNRRLAAILRLSTERIIGSSLLQFIPGAQHARFRQLLDDSADRGGRGEFALVAADGSSVPVHLSLVDLPLENQRTLCGVITDLTGQKKAEDRRIITEDSLQIALEAAEMGHWDLDLVTDRVRRSARHDEIYGHDAAKAPDWSLETYMGYLLAEHRGAVKEALALALTSGKLTFEARIRRASDNAIRWIRVDGHTYFDGSTPVRMAGVLSDITTRRETEDQLRQAQKMEAVGQLTGGLAHDFNNLLTVILGNLERAQAQVNDGTVAVALRLAREAAERGAGLTQQLLLFSRQQQLQTQRLCVNDLLRDLEVLIRRAVGEDIELELALATDLWHCQTDPTQFESAILNLVINARDAMPAGGKVSIRTNNIFLSAGEPAPESPAQATRYVQVSVADDGAGMPASVRERVFEPFFSTKDVGKGTGLGLSMVYGFVKQSDGQVSVQSEEGVGTTLHLFLPGVDESATNQTADAPAAAVHPTMAPAEPARPATILVVEDDPHVRTLVVSLLSELGHSLLVAENGIEAMALLEQRPDVDLLFSDIVMPKGVSGVQVARAARERNPGVGVLLTSGNAGGLSAGVVESPYPFGLLPKPYSQDQLARAIADALAEARDTHRQTPSGARGLAVLIVEDEMLLAMTLADMLQDLGCEVVGPCANLDEAAHSVDTARIDFALLDVHLGGRTTYAFTEVLKERNIPFAFMTGMGAGSLPAQYRDVAVVPKPFTKEIITRALDTVAAR